MALLSGAQQVFGSIRDPQLYRNDRIPAGPRLSGVRFPPPAAARLSAFPEISFPEPVLFPTAGRSVSSLFETSSTAAGVRSPPPNIGGVVPAGPPKWLPFPPPLTARLTPSSSSSAVARRRLWPFIKRS